MFFLLIMSIFCQGHAVVDYGRDFVTAFPENIAYYYPSNLTTILKITALHDNTLFNVIFNGTVVDTETLTAGQSKVVYLPNEVEEYKLSRSSKTVRIISNNNITVFSLSMRGDSIQTNVVQPVTNLGKVYLIPFPNFTETILMLNNYNFSNSTSSSGSSTSQTYSFFRLLVINAEDKDNTVTLTFQPSGTSVTQTSFTLSPFEFIQMQSNNFLLNITASSNVSVLLTHPCLETFNCRCTMVVHQVRPANLQGKSFLVPPFYVTNYSRMFSTSDQSVQLTYGTPPLAGSRTLGAGNSNFVLFFQLLQNGFSNITASKPVSLRLISMGRLTDLIPTSMFSACYLVHSTSNIISQALVIVETNQSSYTHVESGSYTPTFMWNVINGTKYSWATVNLSPLKAHIFWHPFTKMAIYVVERTSTSAVYGGPAISLTEQPDTNGCLLTPLQLNVSNQSISWQEACQYCLGKGGQLASPSWAEAQTSMAKKLTEIGATGQAWIGLRRSLLTTEWYWQNGRGFNFSNWAKGQPAYPEKGMCASVKMEPNGNFAWSSKQCCASMRPVCYIPALYFHLLNPSS